MKNDEIINIMRNELAKGLRHKAIAEILNSQKLFNSEGKPWTPGPLGYFYKNRTTGVMKRVDARIKQISQISDKQWLLHLVKLTVNAPLAETGKAHIIAALSQMATEI